MSLYRLGVTFLPGGRELRGIALDQWMDDRQAAEVLWRGYFIHSKSWLVEAIAADIVFGIAALAMLRRKQRVKH